MFYNIQKITAYEYMYTSYRWIDICEEGALRSVKSMRVVKYFRENQGKEVEFHFGSVKYREELQDERSEYQLNYTEREIKIEELKDN